MSELCLSPLFKKNLNASKPSEPLLFLQIKVSVEPLVVGLEFAVANFLVVQVNNKNNCRANNFKGKMQEFAIYVCHPHRPSRREQKIQPPGPGAEKTQPPRPVPPRKKNTTAPSRLGKKQQPPRPASEKNNNRPVPPRKKKNNRPVPPRILPSKIPSRPVPPRISTPIFCQSRAPAEMKKVDQPSISPPSRPVEILAVHVKPWNIRALFMS